VPLALVSVVDDGRDVLASCAGAPERWAPAGELRLAPSFCRQVVASRRPVVVEDGRGDPVLEDDPAVADLDVGAYAGVPLATAEGRVVGAFCVVDGEPRLWTSGELAVLTDLAASAMTEIALRDDVAERRRTEAALRESEERFRLLVEGTTDHGLFTLDPEGRVASWNAAAEAMTGYRADEIVGRHFGVLYSPEACAAGHPERELELAVASGRCEEQGWRVRRDGTSFWAGVVITALRDPAGRLRGFSKVMRDISERKRVDDALREQSALLDLVPAALFVRDAVTSELTYWSSGARRAYGWAAEEALGRDPHELLETAWPEAPEAVAEKLGTAGRWEGEVRHRTRDGREVVMLSRQALQRDGAGRPRAVLEINTDITERKAAEERLRESEARMRTLVQTAPNAILCVDGDGRVVLAN
jgi:PAS domain S-box-containing protein